MLNFKQRFDNSLKLNLRFWLLAIGCIMELSHAVEMKCDRKLLSVCYIRTPVTLTDGEELNIAPVENEFMVNHFEIVPHSKLNKFPQQIFQTLHHLDTVNLPLADIRTLDQESFRNASKLQNLNLSENNLTALPAAVFKNAPELVRLTLADNRIAEIEDGAFSGLVKLQTLKLNGNRLKVLRSKTFTGLLELEFLHLYWNQLQTIETNAMALPKLSEAYFGHNQLASLSDDLFDGASNLQYTDFGDNQLQRVGDAFTKCDNLINLNLENNPIEDLDLMKFASMKSLAVLSLNNTGLRLPSTPATTEIESPLLSLNLANNHLANADAFVHLSIFPNLKHLYLYNNEFNDFNEPHQIKRLLPKLDTLDLAGNKLISAWLQENNGILQRDRINVLNKNVL